MHQNQHASPLRYASEFNSPRMRFILKCISLVVAKKKSAKTWVVGRPEKNPETINHLHSIVQVLEGNPLLQRGREIPTWFQEVGARE